VTEGSQGGYADLIYRVTIKRIYFENHVLDIFKLCSSQSRNKTSFLWKQIWVYWIHLF